MSLLFLRFSKEQHLCQAAKLPGAKVRQGRSMSQSFGPLSLNFSPQVSEEYIMTCTTDCLLSSIYVSDWQADIKAPDAKSNSSTSWTGVQGTKPRIFGSPAMIVEGGMRIPHVLEKEFAHEDVE